MAVVVRRVAEREALDRGLEDEARRRPRLLGNARDGGEIERGLGGRVERLDERPLDAREVGEERVAVPRSRARDEPGELRPEVSQGERTRRKRLQIGLRERLERVVAEPVRERAEVLVQDVDVTEEELLAVDVELHGRREAVARRGEPLRERRALGIGRDGVGGPQELGEGTLHRREAHALAPGRGPRRASGARGRPRRRGPPRQGSRRPIRRASRPAPQRAIARR